MIGMPERELPPDIADELRNYQDEVDAFPTYATRVEQATKKFESYNNSSNRVFKSVKHALIDMCSGAHRCMYCEDSAANEVEHFRPKSLYPELVFAWMNYLYVCGICNKAKSNRFAVTVNGEIIEINRRKGDAIVPPPPGDPGLIDPRRENPMDFLWLDLEGTFYFTALADEKTPERQRAEKTIEFLKLNGKEHLPKARSDAYRSYRARLKEFILAKNDSGDRELLNRYKKEILQMPHPTVWAEMKRQRGFFTEIKELFDQAPEALDW